MSKLLLALSFAGGIAVAAAGWHVWSREPPERSASELMDVVMWNTEPIGGPFSLVDHNGQPRTDADFRGKLLLVYFGFTFCSDACPVELQSIGRALDQLGPLADAVQPLFITVNPEMDTPAQLKGYVGLFHPRLIGLTGDPRQIRRVARAYKVYFGKSTPAKRDSTQFDHTGFVFVVGADGNYLGYLPPGTPAERMVETLRPYLSALSQS